MHRCIVFLTLTALPICCVQKGVCPAGYFLCLTSNASCIVRDRHCNGVIDCEDGSDETNCDDKQKTEYWNKMYEKRPDEDREKKIKDCDLVVRPLECQCSERNLFCENLGLNHVPSSLPSNLELLDMARNNLNYVEEDYFPPLGHLNTLILTQSKIYNISQNAFRNLPALKNLYLAGNFLEKLQDDVFISNEILHLLILSHNPLYSLSTWTFRGLSTLHQLDLRNCQFSSLPHGVFDPLININILWLDNNRFVTFQTFLLTKLHSLNTLSLSGNGLHAIQAEVFQNKSKLHHLSLAGNKLGFLTKNSLGNITSLKKLDLSKNKITRIDTSSFDGLISLKSLDLRNNPIQDLKSNVFDNLTVLEHIYFDDFKSCSYALKVRMCYPRSDGISSVEHLLDKIILRVCVWIVAVVACIGNFFVFIGRAILKEPNEVHSFYIKNLSMADFLMGLYLFIIAGHDVTFRGTYILHQRQWTSSWQCNFCGFLSTLSSEASVLILTVITIDRYMSIHYPLISQRRNWTTALTYMLTVWTAALFLVSLPLTKLPYFGNEFYSDNGMCLPLHIHHPFARAWEYSTFIFCGINLVAFFINVYAYISMFLTISHSKSGLRSTQQQHDKSIMKRFAFIIGTDFLCWIPIIIIKLVAFTDIPLSVDLYAWIAVFLLPINSALNPVLYTLTTKLFRQNLVKMVQNCQKSNDFSGISLSSFFHHRSSKKSYIANMSEYDHSSFSKSSLQSRKTSQRCGNGLPFPQAV